MELEKFDSVYFVGIGGIGMSAIARWFKQRGKSVGGYDRVKTPLTSELEQEGIWVHYEDKLKDVPAEYRDKDNVLIVYTPAIPSSHEELKFFQKKKFNVLKRSEVLGLISKDHYCVAVGGTHGKTTTSSMVAHILKHSEKGCSAFIGGIMTNYNSNLIIGEKDAPVVVEADEFDRSFHRLSPNHAIVTSVDPDHLDIYGDEEQMKEAFGKFLQLVPEEGHTLIHYKAAEKVNMYLENLYYTYGIDQGDYQAKALRGISGVFYFNYHGKRTIKDLSLYVPGFHNVENAVAAITAAIELGVPSETIKDAIASYKGVKRRFEYILRQDNLIYIDDYAHHPTEIKAFLRSVKSMYPMKKITAIFQPHLYSRTQDFYQGFAESLDQADQVFMLDIYPAREQPVPGVTSQMILDQMYTGDRKLVAKEDIIEELSNTNLDVLVTIGAGDIDQLVPVIGNHFKEAAS
ncbi:UDP-N-acetylmuramate--L-alanine ligase [Marinoscillum sp. MHG1-6]|uniref:UDP-N-acetylmuramate--L-alanine ligase n=1 Tax=Marinoscillum sp. MHG1-6 TaxID=2959627 RepID=UPI00215764DD|nr:UDP-N-acetylmuramate--L-alanine ligase [Marinoscillum sp. MHG1-6]